MKKKLFLGSMVGLTTSTAVGAAVFAMYRISQKQSENNFIIPKHTSIDNLFNSKEEKAHIKETTIAGEKGFIVNKGPIRVSSAYKSLFDKESLIGIANWIYNNVNWGPNALSLKDITFTTGIDKGANGTTKGFHTSGREGSSIFISPDAFEDLGNLGNELFRSYGGLVEKKYDAKYRARIDKMYEDMEKNKLKVNFDDIVSAKLKNFLETTFDGATNNGQKGAYKDVPKETIINLFKEGLQSTWYDNFLSTVPGSQLKTISQTTKFGDGNFTAPERIAYLYKHGKLNEAIEKRKDKIAFDLAYQTIWKATGGKGALGNTYLQLMLRNIIFEEDLKDVNGKVVTYKVLPRDQWDAISGVSKGDDPSDSTKNDGYFKDLNNAGVAKIGTERRAAIYQLFVSYYDKYLGLLKNKDSKGYFSEIGKMWNDKSVILYNNWVNHVSKFDASSRANWLLTGSYSREVKMSVLPFDEWMLTPEDLKKIKSAKSTLGRVLEIKMGDILKDAIENHVIPELGKWQTVKDFYKNHLLDSMKYTISHEYGHHETMWNLYGNYGPASKGKRGIYDHTISLYSESKAASAIENISERELLLLTEIAKQPGFESIQNALQILIRSGDKYSGTWTPSYYGHQYFGYDPKLENWTFASKNLFQPELVFREDENGRKSISLGENEFIGKTPIAFNTNGVDSGSTNQKTNYLYNIDRSKLSTDNPVKKIDPKRVDKFLTMLISPDELLYGYQISKWLLAGHVNGDAWSIANGVALPEIDSSTLTTPTTYFSSILAQDPADNKSKMMTIMGVLRLQLGLSDRDAKEVIAALDTEVKKLYEELVGTADNDEPDLFMPEKTSNISRSRVIFNKIINNTKDVIKASSETDEHDALKAKTGIYYDPKTISYKSISEMLPTYEEELTRFLRDYKDPRLVEKGTVNLGQTENMFADYTGNYAEFLTRLINQFAFRPEYENFMHIVKVKGDDGEMHLVEKLDIETLITYNEGWYDDTNRFYGQGIKLYNVRGKKSNLTKQGAGMINWLRESMGLHVGNPQAITSIPMKGDEVDYAKFDQTIKWADPLSKIYKNNKTNLMSMWGWIPNEEVKKYKYVVLTNKTTGTKTKIKIKLNNTSNYFYYEDMDRDVKKKHSMNEGFTQWVADWFIEGNYSNTDLNIGDYNFEFGDDKGNTYSPYENLDLPKDKKSGDQEGRTTNDYQPIISPMTWYSYPDKKTIEISVKY